MGYNAALDYAMKGKEMGRRARNAVKIVPSAENIMAIIKQEKGDICQVGVELAKRYSHNEGEYNDVWMAAQDCFEAKMEAGPYTLNKRYETIYANNLSRYLKSGKFRGKAKRSFLL